MKRPADEPHAQAAVDALLWKASPTAPGGNSPRATTPAFKALPLPGHPLFPKVPPRLGGLLLPDVSGLGNGVHGDKTAQPPWKVARVDTEQAKAAPVVEVRTKAMAMPEVPKGPATVAPRPQAPPWRAVPAVPAVPPPVPPAVPPPAPAPERPRGPSGNSTATGSTGSGASFSKAAAAASSGLVPNPNDLLRRGEELLRQTAQLHQQNEIAHKKQEEERRKQEEIEKRRAEVEEKRRLEEERKRLVEEEQQNVRRQADEAAQVLQDELRKLIEVAELEVQMAEAESAKIDEPASCEEIVRVSEDFETAALAAQHAVKACFEFMDGRHLKLKGNTEVLGSLQATMSNCASLLKRSHAARASVDMVVLKVRQKAKPAKDELLARSLQAELESLLAVAEEEAATVRKLQEALGKAQRQDGNEADQAVISACDDFEKPGQNALQAALRCTSLLDQNAKQIHGPTEELKARSTKLAGQARQLRSALDQILEKVRLAKMAAIQRIEKEARRVAVEKEAKRQEAIFDQYDQDKDGVLTAGEIVAYVKGEHQFDLAEEKLQQILQNGGVSKQHFARLRSQVAVIWSEILAKQRKERSEKQLLQLRKGAAEIQSALSGVEAEVVKAEAEVRHLPPMIKRAGMMMHQLYERTEAAETAIDAARDFLAAAKEQVFSLDKEIESEAKAMAQTEVRGLQMKVSLLENRLNHAANLTKTARNKLQLEEKKAELMQAAGY